MLALGRHGSRRLMYLSALCRPPTRSASRIAILTSTISQTTTTTPFPVTNTCPEPTCTCAPMPQGLDIDQKTPIAGLSPAYAEQVLICTGHSGWPSRIEDEDSAWFLRSLKSFLGRGGKYSDPFNNVLLTNSSLPPATSDPDMASAFLLPSFTYVSPVAADQVESLVTSHLLPASLPDSHPAPSPHLVRSRSPSALQTRPIDEILVLICGHGSRDNRCGVLGPLLEVEFSHALERVGVKVLSTPPDLNADAGPNGIRTARIASISHIGGHKFAGNVIVYLPPSHGGALAGKGLWYRRIGTGHVQGIVEETIMKGRVIRELFAGGVGRGGEVLRL